MVGRWVIVGGRGGCQGRWPSGQHAGTTCLQKLGLGAGGGLFMEAVCVEKRFSSCVLTLLRCWLERWQGSIAMPHTAKKC